MAGQAHGAGLVRSSTLPVVQLDEPMPCQAHGAGLVRSSTGMCRDLCVCYNGRYVQDYLYMREEIAYKQPFCNLDFTKQPEKAKRRKFLNIFYIFRYNGETRKEK
jgi:hypothetical protein